MLEQYVQTYLTDCNIRNTRFNIKNDIIWHL